MTPKDLSGEDLNATIFRIYAAIAAIPLATILLASAVGGGHGAGGAASHSAGSPTYGRNTPSLGGRGKSEAEAYAGLGKYDPCIVIACKGE